MYFETTSKANLDVFGLWITNTDNSHCQNYEIDINWLDFTYIHHNTLNSKAVYSVKSCLCFLSNHTL